jgi:hypothetical protein
MRTAMRAVGAGKSAMSGIDVNAITARTEMRGMTMIMSAGDIGGRGRGSMRVIRRAILVRMRGLVGGEIEGDGIYVVICDVF